MKLWPLALQFRVECYPAMQTTYCCLMSPLFHLGQRPQEAFQQPSLKEIQQYQPRNHKFSALPLTTRQQWRYTFCKVKEKWPQITKLLEDSPQPIYLHHPEVFHRLRLHLILMRMAYLMSTRKIRRQAKSKVLGQKRLVVYPTLRLKRWLTMPKSMNLKTKKRGKEQTF